MYVYVPICGSNHHGYTHLQYIHLQAPWCHRSVVRVDTTEVPRLSFCRTDANFRRVRSSEKKRTEQHCCFGCLRNSKTCAYNIYICMNVQRRYWFYILTNYITNAKHTYIYNTILHIHTTANIIYICM
jgi:hypothetical protein